MKYLASCALLVLTLGVAGCGTIGFANGPDKSALAQKAVESYWRLAGHGKIDAAYAMLTPGVREGIPRNQYAQNIIGLLTRAGSITVKVQKVYVQGDRAQVRLTLYSPKMCRSRPGSICSGRMEAGTYRTITPTCPSNGSTRLRRAACPHHERKHLVPDCGRMGDRRNARKASRQGCSGGSSGRLDSASLCAPNSRCGTPRCAH